KLGFSFFSKNNISSLMIFCFRLQKYGFLTDHQIVDSKKMAPLELSDTILIYSISKLTLSFNYFYRFHEVIGSNYCN
ncbi:hypothetical protein SB776_40855, partial [Burkholderia sp. SIMBA_045]